MSVPVPEVLLSPFMLYGTPCTHIVAFGGGAKKENCLLPMRGCGFLLDAMITSERPSSMFGRSLTVSHYWVGVGNGDLDGMSGVGTVDRRRVVVSIHTLHQDRVKKHFNKHKNKIGVGLCDSND